MFIVYSIFNQVHSKPTYVQTTLTSLNKTWKDQEQFLIWSRQNLSKSLKIAEKPPPFPFLQKFLTLLEKLNHQLPFCDSSITPERILRMGPLGNTLTTFAALFRKSTQKRWGEHLLSLPPSLLTASTKRSCSSWVHLMRGGLAGTTAFEEEEGLAVPHISFMLLELDGWHRLSCRFRSEVSVVSSLIEYAVCKHQNT